MVLSFTYTWHMSFVPQWSNWYVRVTWLLAFSKLGHILCFLLHKIISLSSEREHLNVECVCRRVLSSHLWEAHTICGNVSAECNAMAGHAGCSVPVSLSTLSAWMLVHVYVCAFCKFYDRRLLQKKKKKSCIKTAIILTFKLFFCNTSVRQCGDSITYSSHCHHAHIVSHVAEFKLSHFFIDDHVVHIPYTLFFTILMASKLLLYMLRTLFCCLSSYKSEWTSCLIGIYVSKRMIFICFSNADDGWSELLIKYNE